MANPESPPQWEEPVRCKVTGMFPDIVPHDDGWKMESWERIDTNYLSVTRVTAPTLFECVAEWNRRNRG